ncbi:MAG TPA: ABC transporter permease [Vicinamibacterales bacterium]|nr:ABC transporter permease [Vicinamibacterales bacterium]
MHSRSLVQDLVQDIRVSVRTLSRAPLLTTTIIATVGLGIGATTVIFAAIDAALLRPLPYVDPGRIVRIYTDSPPNKFHFSVADYQALQAQQTHFEQIAGYTTREMTFSDGSVAERLRGRVVTWTYFSLLGIRPALGSGFAESDGRPGSPPAVMVSHRFWQERLGGRPDAIGKPVRLDGVDHRLAGVLPPIVGPLEQRPHFFVAAQWDTPRRKGPFFITALGRLRSESERSLASDELHEINRRLFPIWRASYQDERATWSMMDLKVYVVGDVRTIAGLALAAVGLVWLISCANASNLLVARVTSRRRELAVRVALGASRLRVVRYLLSESAVLACAAAVVGIVLARVGVGLLRDFGADYFPRTAEIGLSGSVRWVLLALTAASVALFGLIPAMHGTGGALDDSLRSAGRSSTGNVAVRRLRRVLVASQFAIATPLLIVAGLLAASLHQLARVDLGFDTENVLTGSILLPDAQYEEPGRVAAFWNELQNRVEALPGVTAVAFSDGRPPNDVGNFNNFDLEEYPTRPGQSQPVTPWVAVTPEYFKLLGLTLVEGRLFDDRDGRGANVESVIVDRAWAKRFFPNRSALGKRFREGGCTTCPWTTVVGVVSDVKYAGLDKPDDGSVYWPMAGRGNVVPIEAATTRFRYLIVRTDRDAMAVLPSVRRIVRDLDPSIPLSSVALIDDLVATSLQSQRSLSMLIAALAIVALVLSTVGIYGVMAYYVQQHAKDISIRLALGGGPADVLHLVVGQGMKVVAAGVALGLLAAVSLTRLMASLLFGVSRTDAFTLTCVCALLLLTGLLACYLPARRAIGLEPAAVLRQE